MRRADRLFQIVLLLRTKSLLTASQLGRELGVSERTIYRDIRDLVDSGIPIEGEAGVGYALPLNFELPPLMFTRREVETLVLALRMVSAFGGEELQSDAASLRRKVEAVLPPDLRGRLDDVHLFVPDFHVRAEDTAFLGPLRRAVHEHLKVRMAYTRRDGEQSERTVRPLALSFWGLSWTLTAWCELREDYRTFRPDRMRELTLTDEAFEDEPGRDYATFLERMRERWGPWEQRRSSSSS